MNPDFLITGIDSIIYVDETWHTDPVTDFSHVLKSNELILHLSGSSTVYFDEETFFCTDHTLRFLPAGSGEKYIVALPENIRKGNICIDIFFRSSAPISERAFIMDTTHQITIRALFQKVFSVWTARAPGYYHESISLIYRIFAEIEKKSSYIPNRKYGYIAPAIEYINQNFMRSEISCKELAARCDVSYSYVKKLFREKFGMPPERYIMQMRMHYSQDLLKTGRYPVAKVAEMAGFSDPNYFSRCFRAQTGVSPSSFRAQIVGRDGAVPSDLIDDDTL